MRIGYARVSTADQNLDLQRDALRRARCGRLYEDRASGSNTDRPELKRCLAQLRAGDCLVVWRLDRLGRSLVDLIRIVTDLGQRGVAFESVTERIETASPIGRFMFHLLGALAEFERSLIRERILAGLAAARARGQRVGRPRKLDSAAIRRLEKRVKYHGESVAEAGKRLGVSRATAYRVLAKLHDKSLARLKKMRFTLDKICYQDTNGRGWG